MQAPLNAFLTALMLLTRVPVGRWCTHSPQAVAASVAFFPAVGALVGLASALALGLTLNLLPVKLAVCAAMLAGVALTGAIHEDGFADAADGLFGGSSPAQRMEIMKDSRIGSYGAIALWFALSCKWFLLTELAASGFSNAWKAIVLAHCLARTGAVAVLHLLPHVGTDPLRAKPFCERLPKPALVATLLAPAILCSLLASNLSAPILAATTLCVFACTALFRNKLGGITGDCLGATVVLSELAVLTVCSSSL